MEGQLELLGLHLVFNVIATCTEVHNESFVLHAVQKGQITLYVNEVKLVH